LCFLSRSESISILKALQELAATIKERGILQPIGVADDGERYVGLWGQRRFMAAKLAGFTAIPAIVREKPAADADAVEIRLIENLARQSLRPIEQAMGLRSLQKARAITDQELARRVGIGPWNPADPWGAKQSK